MGFILSKKNEKDQKTVHLSFVNSKSLLIIFTRNPELGKCKTRLAATIGDEAALQVYKFLLAHTVKITSNLNIAKQVHYSVKVREDDIWDNLIYDKKQQQGKDLGERMAHAFEEGFASGFEKICIIGSDMFDLVQNDIEDAFQGLDHSDYVIGPAVDGGYYMLGMKKFNPIIFQNKKWGADTVYKDTINDLEGESIYIKEVRNDIDRYEDISHVAAFQPFLKHL
ncbi:TIGR04282 family arsenosugar biosynthesis glycosyltransferase [Maribacter algicola]|uniref:TIGR04282 family arsenosugar biosynthesis glycosyltransferase n=1 Tax=Meishania litoralis TaxID=3434685 RepID=A0ACC7LJ35_9FLAO